MHNSRSLVSKLSLFQSFVYSHLPSICVITETWLTANIYDNEIIPTGYSIFRCDRASRGGGVLIAVDSNLTSSLIPSPPSALEYISVKVDFQAGASFILCACYVPPLASDLI